MDEPLCAACGRTISTCAADIDNCAPCGSVDPNPTTSDWRVVDSYSTGGGVHDSWRALGPWRATQEEARRDAAAEARVKGLERERDKARRVAKVLIGPAKHLKILGHDLTADELKAIDTALAYPGREP